MSMIGLRIEGKIIHRYEQIKRAIKMKEVTKERKRLMDRVELTVKAIKY